MAKRVKQKQTNMDNIQIFVDTNMDITPEYAEENNLRLLRTTTFKNYDLLTAYTNTPINLNEYYNDMRDPKNHYNTAAIPPAGYEEAFAESFEEGKDILYLHFSGPCSSAATNNIRLAKIELEKRFPKRKLYLVDTKQVCAGGRLIVQEVIKLVNDGNSLEEILNWCKIEINKFALYFVVDDIKYMHRSGRVSKTSAVFGTILNIKPISRVKDDGIIEVYHKVRGEKVAAKQMLRYSIETADRQELIKRGIVICDSGNEVMADYLEELFKEEYGQELVVIRTKINPVIGVHSGPGVFGVAFYANHR
jgi:DegV family protein with EDD domain